MEVPKGNSRFRRLLSIFLLKHSLFVSLQQLRRILDQSVLLGKEDLDVYTKGGLKAQARLCVYISRHQLDIVVGIGKQLSII